MCVRYAIPVLGDVNSDAVPDAPAVAGEPAPRGLRAVPDIDDDDDGELEDTDADEVAA
jgi:hypothetical protein